MQKITPCLWFDNQAEEASKFYVSLFRNSKIGNIERYGKVGAKVSGRKKGSVMTVGFKLSGQEFIALNGGSYFKFSPAISFFVNCKTKGEVDRLFKKLSRDGEILMALGKYPFSERFVFLKDKFGVSWQLMLSPKKSSHIIPCLLFVGKDLGKAESAIKFYTKVFKHSKVKNLTYYGKAESGKGGDN